MMKYQKILKDIKSLLKSTEDTYNDSFKNRESNSKYKNICESFDVKEKLIISLLNKKYISHSYPKAYTNNKIQFNIFKIDEKIKTNTLVYQFKTKSSYDSDLKYCVVCLKHFYNLDMQYYCSDFHILVNNDKWNANCENLLINRVYSSHIINFLTDKQFKLAMNNFKGKKPEWLENYLLLD